MSEPFIAEIRIFPYTFPPKSWARCDGELLQISQNPSLFSIIGDRFGGDGRTTMGLPNLKGRSPMHQGTGPGLTPRPFASAGGYPDVPLSKAQIPAHNHNLQVTATNGNTNDPGGNYTARDRQNTLFKVDPPSQSYVQMASDALPTSGQSLGHINIQPFLSVNFCIALQGIYPPRN